MEEGSFQAGGGGEFLLVAPRQAFGADTTGIKTLDTVAEGLFEHG